VKRNMFELAKVSKRTNARNELLYTPIVSYGYVVSVIDEANVKVRDIVQRGSVHDVYSVRLVALGNDAKQDKVVPQKDDEVVVFFTRSFDPAMMVPTKIRREATGDATIQNPSATGYDKYSAIGFLAKAMTGNATDLVTYRKDGDVFTTARTVASKVATLFRNTVNVVFDSKSKTEDAPVTVTLGPRSPLGVRIKAAIAIMLWDKAPLTLDTESAIGVTSTKPVSVETEDALNLKSGENTTIESGKKVVIKNSSQSFATLIGEFVDTIVGLQTVGTAAAQALNPATIAQLNALKVKLQALLEA